MGKKSKKEEVYEVEKVVDARGSGKKKEYLVKWVGYSSKENTWEPPSNLSDVMDLVKEYEESLKPAAKPAKPAAAPPKAAPKAAAAPAKKSPPKKAPPPPPPRSTRASPAPKEAAGKKRVREEAPEPPPAKVAKAAPKAKEAPKKAPKEAPKKAAKATPIVKKGKEKEKKKDEKIDILSISKLLMSSISGGSKGAKEKEKPKEKVKPPKEKEPPKKAAKEAPKPAAKEKKKPKVPDDVAEVDKILGMKVGDDGAIFFQISWKQKGKMGKVTWEPEDNIMDDDLVDEFEEAQQIKVYGGDEIKTGSEVEVKNVMEGFQNSWTVASVTSKKGDKFSVSYDGFVDEKGNAEVEKGVDRSRLRLAPEKVSGWSPMLGEIIEINEDGCWWEAKVQEKKGKSLKVMFRVSDEVKTVNLGAKTRPCSWLKLLNKK